MESMQRIWSIKSFINMGFLASSKGLDLLPHPPCHSAQGETEAGRGQDWFPRPIQEARRPLGPDPVCPDRWVGPRGQLLGLGKGVVLTSTDLVPAGPS